MSPVCIFSSRHFGNHGFENLQALLRLAFVEFRRRGYERVALSVDSANATGATALYERVGMRAVLQSDIYEKRLR